MISSGFTGLQLGTAYAAGNATLSTPAPQRTLSHAGSLPSTQTHGPGRYRYFRLSEQKPAGKARVAPRRPRRDTMPLWPPAHNASDVVQPDPLAPPSNVFIKPQLSATHRRTHELLVSAYGEIFGCKEIEAEAILQRIDATLYEAWRDIVRIGDIDWPQDQPEHLCTLAYGASAFALRLRQSPHLSDEDALAIAKLHLRSETPFLPDDDHRHILYQGVLERGLHWIDPNKARVRHLSATDILQLVYHHRRPRLANRAALRQALQRERGVLIDEAALIHFHTKADPADIDPDAQIDIIRQQYANALSREWLDASLGLHVLPSSPVGLTNYPFWFDGNAIPNSFRKPLEQIVSEAFSRLPCEPEGETLEKIKHNTGFSRRLFGQPEYPITRANWEELVLSIGGEPGDRFPYHYRSDTINIDGWRIDRDELYTLFERTMQNLGLDTVYPAGTPHHEMAATLRQIGFAHRVVPNDFNNPAELMEAFNRLQDEWRHHPRSPVSPVFMTGLNLARRNNVFIMDTQSELSRKRQAWNQAYRDALPALAQAGVDRNADMQYWQQLNGSGKNPLEILADLAASPMAERLPIYESLQKRVDALLASPESIAYAGTNDLIARIHDYFHQHLLAHAAPPTFNELKVVTRILRDKLAMTDEDLRTRRSVSLGPPSLNNRPLNMLPIDEFLTRRQLFTSTMQHGNNIIAPADEWNTAQIDMVKRMATHPIVVAKSKDLLRRRGGTYNQTDIDILAESQAVNIVDPSSTIAPLPRPLSIADWQAFLDGLFGSPTLGTIANALSSGDPRQIAELFPFVIPIFDIATGMVERDWKRALDGLIHLGEDALFTLAGAAMEGAMARSVARATEAMLLARAATPLTERVAVDSLRELGNLLPEFAETQFGGLPQVIRHDAFEVHAAGSHAERQTIPKAAEAAGPAPKRPGLQIQHLDVDGEDIIVTPSAHGYTEINYRGEPVPGAPPIFTDPNSGEHFRQTKEFGWPNGIAGVSEREVAERSSVAAVIKYWETIDLPTARIASPAPLDIIRSLIQPNDHPQHADLEKLLADAYTRSETARVIINHAYSRAPYDRRRCVIRYDTDHASQYGARIDFMSSKALSRNFYTGPAGDVRFQDIRHKLHEILHFLTDLLDALIHEAHSHRGGNIALLEKVMNEMLGEPPHPPRLCYQKQKFPLLNQQGGIVSTNSLIPRHLLNWSIVEDRKLDEILDQGREFPATMYAMGQKITERVTVRQGLALAEHLSKKARKLSAGNIAKIIPVILDGFDLPSDHYKTILKNLLNRSRTFQRLAVAWEDRSRHTPVNVALMPHHASIARYAQQRRISHIISLAADKIWLNRSPLYYFSVTDTTEISDERALLDALLDLFVNAIVPDMEEIALDKTTDRGVSVLLSNAIMRQMAESRSHLKAEPDRICLALTSDDNAYLPDQSALTRAAFSENGFLFKFNKNMKLPTAEEEEAELRQCAAEQGARYSLFSCLGVHAAP